LASAEQTGASDLHSELEQAAAKTKARTHSQRHIIPPE
jgi:hypothetical protein